MLAISGLQHFAVCKRQWALIHLEGQWQENLLTTQGKIMHTRVHDQEQSEVLNGVIILRSMPLRSLALGLYGVADVVEFHPVSSGIALVGHTGKYLPKPIEYKRGKAKTDDCDRIQLCAQALCLEEMLRCQIPHAEIFYGETRRRERIALDGKLREKTSELCTEMRKHFIAGVTPPAIKCSACSRCSLQPICLPNTSKRSAAKYWASIMKGLMDGS